MNRSTITGTHTRVLKNVPRIDSRNDLKNIPKINPRNNIKNERSYLVLSPDPTLSRGEMFLAGRQTRFRTNSVVELRIVLIITVRGVCEVIRSHLFATIIINTSPFPLLSQWQHCMGYSECDRFMVSLYYAYGCALLKKGSSEVRPSPLAMEDTCIPQVVGISSLTSSSLFSPPLVSSSSSPPVFSSVHLLILFSLSSSSSPSHLPSSPPPTECRICSGPV